MAEKASGALCTTRLLSSYGPTWFWVSVSDGGEVDGLAGLGGGEAEVVHG